MTGSSAPASDPCFAQPTELPHSEPLWPTRPEQSPEIVRSVAAFLEALLFETHLDRVVVLPNGITLLGQQHGIPDPLRQACLGASRASSGFASPQGRRSPARAFLSALGKEDQEQFRARLWHYSTKGTEKEVKKEGKRRSLHETLEQLHSEDLNGTVHTAAPLYISELRWLGDIAHPLTQRETVTTALTCDIYDFTALSRRMPLWKRSGGGIFVGERGAGSGMHVDQCLWSNVGRNWCGHKLLAVWPWEERLRIPTETGKGRVFHMPLTPEEVGWLSRAKVVALLRPGDVFIFCGAQPHSALVVGEGLNVSAYESFVPANSEAVGLLVRSNTRNSHWDQCWMDDDDLDELYEDVVDNLQDSLRGDDLSSRLRSALNECVCAMREKGDSYCRELWRKEDRRREQSTGEEESSSGSSECGRHS